MSKIYKLLTNLSTNSIENTNNDTINVSKTSNIDCEIQKVHQLHKLIFFNLLKIYFVGSCMIFKKELFN